MSRYVRIDRSYNQPYRLTGYGCRAVLKWAGLIFIWLVADCALTLALNPIHLGILGFLIPTAGLIWYAVYSVRRNRAPLLAQPTYRPAIPKPNQWQFNTPPVGSATRLVAATGLAALDTSGGGGPSPRCCRRAQHAFHPTGRQDRGVGPGSGKMRAVRLECGLAPRPQDSVVAGGTNTVNNIQLLCGRCNRIKGADDIPV
jgi:hypothetical protein